MKQFKARVEKPTENWHAIEIYFESENIIDAGVDIMNRLGPLGIDTDNVTKLIEIEIKIEQPKCAMGYVNCTYLRPNDNTNYHKIHHR